MRGAATNYLLYYQHMDYQTPLQGDNPKLSQGQHPAYNPRKISDFDYANLKQSMLTFGPLEGIVKNVCTSNFVGGNQRTRGLRELGADDITITWRATETPDPSGPATLAYGYVTMNGERFSYREVYWPTDAVDSNGNAYSSKERAANIAANRIQGEWDDELRSQIDYELSQLSNAEELLAQTGQDPHELEKLLEQAGVMPNGEEEPDGQGDDPHDSNDRKITATKEQWEVIDEALENVIATHEMYTDQNSTKKGTALYYLAREHLDRIQGLTDQPQAAVQSNPQTPGGLTDIPT